MLKLANKNQVIIIFDSQISMSNIIKITLDHQKMSILENFFLVINFVNVNMIVCSRCYQRFIRLVLSFWFFGLIFYGASGGQNFWARTWYYGLFVIGTSRNCFLKFSEWTHLSWGLTNTVFALAIAFDFRWFSWLVVCLHFLFSTPNIL